MILAVICPRAGTVERGMAKVAMFPALTRNRDRSAQVVGRIGGDTIVEQVFPETRAFRIYDGSGEDHKCLTRTIIRDRKAARS